MNEELELTWKRAFRICLEYWWRSLVGHLCAAIVGFGLARIVGLTLSLLGVKSHASVTLPIVAVVIVWLGLSLAATLLPLVLIIGKNFGDFRIVVLPKKEVREATGARESLEL